MDMSMAARKVGISEIFPHMGFFDGVMVSRNGTLTLGWEVFLPTAYSLTEDEYDDLIDGLSSAVRTLPPWSIVHKQDVFIYDTYSAGDTSGLGFLEASYEKAFDGRRYLTHRSFLFVSFSNRGAVESSARTSGLTGFLSKVKVKVPAAKDFDAFVTKCREFTSILSSGGRFTLRELSEEDWFGSEDGSRHGIIETYMMLGRRDGVLSDVQLAPDRVVIHDKVLQAYTICDSRLMPTELPSVKKVGDLSSIANTVFLSTGAKIGLQLDCEHVANLYIVVPPQDEINQKMDGERKKMEAGLSSADNRVNAGELGEYLDDVYRYGLLTVKMHANVLAWDTEEKQQELRGKVSSAVTEMGITAVYNRFDTPILYYAGIPGNASQLSAPNLMNQELTASLCLGVYESFDPGIAGGRLKLCDRITNRPLTLDIDRVARDSGLIDNFNAFVLGPSGSGKSFTTNTLLRNSYDHGGDCFVIDVGDSYEGLCGIINEASGGRDGQYHAWDPEHPFSFNMFMKYREWLDGDGNLRMDENDISFCTSFLQTLWSPVGGWTETMKNVLLQTLKDFITQQLGKNRDDADGYPLLDDYVTFLTRKIKPLVEKGGYSVGSIKVDQDRFDVVDFIGSLGQYRTGGSYGFLLNDPHPRDLFSSRFTVFEVDALSKGDAKFYSLCVLCIMNAFETKMRRSMNFKQMVIDEAWKAIANETMAPYLNSLWKTARKYSCAAMVITQQLSDIMSSTVLRDTILQNSSVRILLDQSSNQNNFDDIMDLLGLTEKDKDLILSVNRSPNPAYRYKEVFIAWGTKRSGVYAVEVSPEEALVFESDKTKKRPLLDRAAACGSIIEAVRRTAEEKRRSRS